MPSVPPTTVDALARQGSEFLGGRPAGASAGTGPGGCGRCPSPSCSPRSPWPWAPSPSTTAARRAGTAPTSSCTPATPTAGRLHVLRAGLRRRSLLRRREPRPAAADGVPVLARRAGGAARGDRRRPAQLLRRRRGAAPARRLALVVSLHAVTGRRAAGTPSCSPRARPRAHLAAVLRPRGRRPGHRRLACWGRRRPVAAGVLLGLALAARLYPVLLLVALVLLAVRTGAGARRRRRRDGGRRVARGEPARRADRLDRVGRPAAVLPGPAGGLRLAVAAAPARPAVRRGEGRLGVCPAGPSSS